ncbi:MAG: hypothetical protein M1828_005571 [Chrysothrix sp. TS-e1954]|nr:MAG: hypothetical protein M1828_005571 [Chrysothrix sp. TS-e1954]
MSTSPITGANMPCLSILDKLPAETLHQILLPIVQDIYHTHRCDGNGPTPDMHRHMSFPSRFYPRTQLQRQPPISRQVATRLMLGSVALQPGVENPEATAARFSCPCDVGNGNNECGRACLWTEGVWGPMLQIKILDIAHASRTLYNAMLHVVEDLSRKARQDVDTARETYEDSSRKWYEGQYRARTRRYGGPDEFREVRTPLLKLGDQVCLDKHRLLDLDYVAANLEHVVKILSPEDATASGIYDQTRLAEIPPCPCLRLRQRDHAEMRASNWVQMAYKVMTHDLVEVAFWQGVNAESIFRPIRGI